jgi:hypothetical protein
MPVFVKALSEAEWQILSFSIAEGFSGVVDELLKVDLRDSDAGLLR